MLRLSKFTFYGDVFLLLCLVVMKHISNVFVSTAGRLVSFPNF